MKTIYTLALFCMFGLLGNSLHAQCIDNTQIDSTQICPKVYQPVCGCNGVTYANACIAETYNGITSHTPGICNASLQQCCNASFDYDVIVGISGYTVTFNNLSTGCFAQQKWEFGNGTGSSDFEPNFTYLNNQFPEGKAKVCLTVYNLPDSCYDKICGYVYFDEQTNLCVDNRLITNNPCPIPQGVVCGCNGVQYDSGCEATNGSGVTGWHTGPCPAVNTCMASFEYEIATAGTGFRIDFTNTSDADNNTNQWNFGNGATSTLQHPSYTYTVPNTYTVCLTSINSVTNCTSTYCRLVKVAAPVCIDSSRMDPFPLCPTVEDPVCGCDGVTYDNFCIAAAGGLRYWRPAACGTELCYSYFNYTIDSSSGTVTFNNRATSNTFITWHFDDTTSSATNLVHTFAIPGVYQVCLSSIDGSCSDYYCDSIYLDFTGIANRDVVTDMLHIYPNPFSSEVHITFKGQTQAPATLWVTDLAGKRIATLSNTSHSSSYTWHAEGQPAGYYLLHYESNGLKGVEKLLLVK